MRAMVIDGVEIPEALLAQEAQNHPSASAADARAAAGHALAIRALLLHRAWELRLTAEPEIDDQGREETEAEALIRDVLDIELEVARPTERECRRVYESHPSRFQSPALYEASHILIAPDGSGEAAARRLVETLQAQIAAGALSFADAARTHSACPSGAVGGSLGQLGDGDLVAEVEDALACLQPGEITPAPVRSRYGWHLLRLDRRMPGRRLPFEAVRDQISLHLESRAWTAAAGRYASTLTAAARAQGVALSLTEAGAVHAGSAALGDFLSDTGLADRLEAWLAAVDPDLALRVTRAAAAAGEPVADFARAAMAEFVSGASDERWTNLISATRDAADPALAGLATVLRSKLAPAKRVFTVIRRVAS